MEIELDNLIILNDYDRPCMYLLATKEPLQYACKSMKKKFPDISDFAHRATPLREFGFIQNRDTFIKVNESTAKYQDGRPRDWQGRTAFSAEQLLNVEEP